ncbi:hypothetical protein P5P86_16995 [Nocardioides sp. BP30]|uniref:hypothetical protein n=1 Tax=Nocardioides sp. BP30 TaxID=3036374 RepID=UPI00246918EC|nr:hypothetical protein [Nocardioides sp. BP30]WGL51645.1 hypothetical protein P5P86_16995 [Nocardioides sp. BP30]
MHTADDPIEQGELRAVTGREVEVFTRLIYEIDELTGKNAHTRHTIQAMLQSCLGPPGVGSQRPPVRLEDVVRAAEHWGVPSPPGLPPVRGANP